MKFTVSIPCTVCSVALWTSSNEVEVLERIEAHAKGSGWRFFPEGVHGGAWICCQCMKFHMLDQRQPSQPEGNDAP